MKMALFLSLLLLNPSLTAQQKPTKEETELKIEQEKGDTKLKLALIAALVTMWIVYNNGKGDDAITFNKFIMFLWQK